MTAQRPDYKKFNEYLNSIPPETFQAESEKQAVQDEKDFTELKEALKQGKCSYCGNPLSHFSDKKPCFHWLLKPKGFKKRHFPLLFAEKGFHELEPYVRWVANCDVPVRNINDLVEEKSSTKVIEETIRYKNLEWSFSCSHNDMQGHENAHEGTMPHYHFQMKVDGNVVINYGGFHIPFNDYDMFCFAVKRGEFDRIRAAHAQGAGMQALFDNLAPEELLDLMQKSPDNDESRQQFHIQSMVMADEGATISGDDIADIIKEHKETGIPIAKLIRKLKNVTATTYISPGPGVPQIAARKPNRSRAIQPQGHPPL